MPREKFDPSKYTPTKWDSAEEKARFADDLIAFIEAGFPEKSFTKRLYVDLSGCFGNIAHHDRGGFFAAWFTNATDQAQFLQELLQWPCYGDPTYTWCDVERDLQKYVREHGLLAQAQAGAISARESRERAELVRLKAKYEGA